MTENNQHENPYNNTMDSQIENNNVYYNRPGQSTNGASPFTRGGQKVAPPNSFARISVILGGVALASVFTFTIFPAVILGSLSLVLALLSRGKELTFHPSAKSATILASIALVANVALVGGTVYTILGDSPMHDELNETYEEMFGMTYDEILQGVMDGSVDINDLYEQMYDELY